MQESQKNHKVWSLILKGIFDGFQEVGSFKKNEMILKGLTSQSNILSNLVCPKHDMNELEDVNKDKPLRETRAVP